MAGGAAVCSGRRCCHSAGHASRSSGTLTACSRPRVINMFAADCSGKAWWPGAGVQPRLHSGRSQTRQDERPAHWPPLPLLPGTPSHHLCLGSSSRCSWGSSPLGSPRAPSPGPRLERPVSGVGSGVAGSPRLTDLTHRAVRGPLSAGTRGRGHPTEGPCRPLADPWTGHAGGHWRTLGRAGWAAAGAGQTLWRPWHGDSSESQGWRACVSTSGFPLKPGRATPAVKATSRDSTEQPSTEGGRRLREPWQRPAP